MKKVFTFAFTLAEVLITLGIIGIVAALTIPTLVTKYQEKATVAKLKEFYSTMSQNYLFAVSEYGTPEGWGITGRDASDTSDSEVYNARNAILLRDRLLTKAKVIQKCDNAKDRSTCGLSNKYFFMNGTVRDIVSGSTSQTTSALLANGSGIMFIANPAGQIRGSGALSKTYGVIYIDVNGTKPPNKYGHDLFLFYLTKENITPAGTKAETFNSFSSCYTNGTGCAAWVIQNQNMDYLHCSGLSWDGKHKCSD